MVEGDKVNGIKFEIGGKLTINGVVSERVGCRPDGKGGMISSRSNWRAFYAEALNYCWNDDPNSKRFAEFVGNFYHSMERHEEPKPITEQILTSSNEVCQYLTTVERYNKRVIQYSEVYKRVQALLTL